MSMYLPNPDVGPIGAEVAEFIDTTDVLDELPADRYPIDRTADAGPARVHTGADQP